MKRFQLSFILAFALLLCTSAFAQQNLQLPNRQLLQLPQRPVHPVAQIVGSEVNAGDTAHGDRNAGTAGRNPIGRDRVLIRGNFRARLIGGWVLKKESSSSLSTAKSISGEIPSTVAANLSPPSYAWTCTSLA